MQVKERLTVAPPRLEKSGGQVVASSEFRIGKRVDTLWFSVPEEYEGFLFIDNATPFLFGVLPIALHGGYDIELEAPISPEIVFGFDRLVSMFGIVVPDSHRIELIPSSLAPHSETASRRGVITGFSCGVDSLMTIADYFFNSRLADYKLTHLLFTNTGANGLHPERSRRVFDERLPRIQKAAEEIGLDLIAVDSNVHHFEHYKYINTHELFNGAVAHLLSGGIHSFLLSSGYDYQRCFTIPPNDTAYIDTSILPLMSTRNLRMFAVGGEYTRIQKTECIAKFDVTQHHLNVCVSGIENCSQCKKCVRTMLMLDLLGMLDNFHRVFDIARFRENRDYYLSEVIADPTGEYNDEILAYLDRAGIEISAALRLKGKLKKIMGGLARAVNGP